MATVLCVMRILITGITGFVGGHLAEALLARGGAEVFGLSRLGRWPDCWAHLGDRVPLRAADLRDLAAIEAVLAQWQPQQIVHLAGYAHVGASFRQPEAAWADNLTATLNLYRAIEKCNQRPRILYVSSGLIYGDGNAAGQPLDETAELRPLSPYAASKAAADLASFQWAQAPGLDIVRARPFNHIGPRQSPQYAVAHFASQIAAVEKGRRAPLLDTGDLRPRRDLSDVRDVVQAYLLLLDKGCRGQAYNVGSGQLWSIREVLDRLLALSTVRVEVRQQADQLRPLDASALCADTRKLQRETGWTPRYSLDQTLRDTLDYWRTASE